MRDFYPNSYVARVFILEIQIKTSDITVKFFVFVVLQQIKIAQKVEITLIKDKFFSVLFLFILQTIDFPTWVAKKD